MDHHGSSESCLLIWQNNIAEKEVGDPQNDDHTEHCIPTSVQIRYGDSISLVRLYHVIQIVVTLLVADRNKISRKLFSTLKFYVITLGIFNINTFKQFAVQTIY